MSELTRDNVETLLGHEISDLQWSFIKACENTTYLTYTPGRKG